MEYERCHRSLYSQVCDPIKNHSKIPKRNDDATAKKVTFAEADDHSGDILEREAKLVLRPSANLTFTKYGCEISSHLKITNTSDLPITFKIKTTSADKFKVRPSIGVLDCDESTSVYLTTVEELMVPSDIANEKFSVMGLTSPRIDMTYQEVTDLWKNKSMFEVEQHKLKCCMDLSDRLLGRSATFKTKDSLAMIKTSILESSRQLNVRMRHIKLVQYAILAMIAVMLGTIYFYIKGDSHRICYHKSFRQT